MADTPAEVREALCNVSRYPSTMDEHGDALATIRAHIDTLSSQLAALQAERDGLAEWRCAMFDGHAVYKALTPRAAAFVSHECVSEVLDAAARVARNAILAAGASHE